MMEKRKCKCMTRLDELFYRSDTGQPIEGFLSDDPDPQPQVLFILKEPHNSNETEFWFHHVVNRKQNYMAGNGKRFYTVLGCLACLLTGENGIADKNKDRALQKCAYINLYPFSGAKNVRMGAGKLKNGYLKTNRCIDNRLNGAKLKQDDEKAIDYALRRIKLINELPESGIQYIVTVQDFYSVLKKAYSVNNTEKTYISLNYNRYGKQADYPKEFRTCRLESGIELFEFWHPSYSYINYNYLSQAIIPLLERILSHPLRDDKVDIHLSAARAQLAPEHLCDPLDHLFVLALR